MGSIETVILCWRGSETLNYFGIKSQGSIARANAQAIRFNLQSSLAVQWKFDPNTNTNLFHTKFSQR